MKILFIPLLLIIAMASQAQVYVQRSNGAVTPVDDRLATLRSLKVPVVADTAAGLIAAGVDSLGLIIQVRSTGDWWKRDTSAGTHKWTKIGSGGSGVSDTTALMRKANNLGDVGSASASRTNLGLGTAAVKDIPSSGDASTSQVVYGTDTRLSNARAPTGSAGGDLTGSYPNPTIANNSISNGKAAQMAAHTYKGNNTASTANQADITATQLTADLDVATTTTKGAVPPPGTATGKVLQDDLAWHVPSAGFADPLTTNGDIIARIAGITTRLPAPAHAGMKLGWNGTALVYQDTTAGGGTPGGSNTYVQYNDVGSFGANSGFTYNATNRTVSADSILTVSSRTDSGYANNLKLRTSQVTGDSAFLTRRYVISMGNSLTAAAVATKYYFGFAYQFSYFLGVGQINFGVPGQVLYGNELSIITHIPQYNPSIHQAITLEYGVNDAAAGVTTAHFTGAVSQWIDSCVIRGWPLNKTIVFSVPYSGTSRNTANFPFIAAAQSACTSRGAVFVDAYNYMKNNGGYSLTSSDSTHPNDKGYSIMAEAALKVISPSIIPAGWQKVFGTLTVGGPYHGPGKLNVFGGDAMINGVMVGSGNIQDSNSTALGVRSLQLTTASGVGNTAVGFQTLQSDTSGSSNTAVGASALKGMISGSNNTAVGKGALQFATSNDNTAIGSNALIATTSGARLTAVGSSALGANTTGSDNIAIGYNAQITAASASANVSIGNFSMQFAGNSSSSNVAVGHSAMRNITSGTGNVGIGANATLTNTTGGTNTGIGQNALLLNSTGSGNVGIGANAGTNETGSNKLYIANSASNNLLYGDFSTGQIQINAASTPSLTATAAFEVRSTTRGMLEAVMTTTQRNAISSPATGLRVTQSDSSGLGGYYDGSAWQTFADRNWVRMNFGSLGSNPFSDATALVKDNADATKTLRFELAGLSTSTAIVATPPTSSFSMARIDAAQTFIGVQTHSSPPVLNNILYGKGSALTHRTDSSVGQMALAAGYYTPTLTAGTNCGTVVALQSLYSITDSVVTCTIKGNFQATAPGQTIVNATLPIAAPGYSSQGYMGAGLWITNVGVTTPIIALANSSTSVNISGDLPNTTTNNNFVITIQYHL